MSGGLRQAIPNHKRSLHARIKEAEALLSKAIPTSLDERQDHIDELTVQHQVVASTIGRLAAIDQQWLELMATIEDEEDAAAEHDHYANTASHETDGYHELLERGEHVQARINTRIARLEKSTNIAPNPTVSAFPPAAQVAASPSMTSAPRQLIHLPKLSLPVFDGNILKFPEFWSLYNATVHSRTDMTPMTKLAYLMPQLTGAAERAVEGYPKTDEYYEMIIKRLKERFEHTDDRFTSMLHAELKRISSCSPKTEDKRRTLDACERIFRQLEQCGDELDPGRSLVFDLLAKFPHGMIKDLERHYKVGVYSKLSDVRTTMEKCITEEEMTYGFLRDLTAMKPQDSSKDNGKKSYQQNSNGNRRDYQNYQESRKHDAETTFAANAKQSNFNRTDGDRQGQPPNPCYFCGQRHFNFECKAYPSAKSRLRRLQQLGRCNRCLINHGDNPCRRNLFCRNCNTDSHNKTLCFKLFPEKDNRSQANPQPNRDFSSKTHMASAQPATTPNKDGQHVKSLTATEITNFSNSCRKNSLFQTAKVTARNLITGEECKVRICLDTLSNRTYITEKAARMLNLPSEGEDKLYVSVFGTNKDVDVVSQIVSFGLQQSDGKILNIEANTTRIISNSAILPKEWPASEEMIIRSMGSNLADDPFDTNKYIDVLIGADYTWQILQGPKAELRGCDVYLIPTVFGLMLGGQLHYKTSKEKYEMEMTMFCLTESTSPYPSELGMITVEAKHQTSYPDIDEFWNLETVGITDSPTVDEDQQALQQFKETVIYQDGRYHAKWPWIPERKVHLPSNYNVALKRFRSLTTRLLSEPELLQGYRNTITQQIEKGVIEKVPPEEVETTNAVHYLPHHPVLNKASATTKLRIVYDASAKQRRHDLSLNECLLRGPVLLPDLCQLLIRFRLGHTVVISDVEKAFLQVGVQPEDRDVNRFLWYEDDTHPSADFNNIAMYRFARVAFGIVSSPFILGATILHHLEVEGTPFAKRLKSDIYVDNIISSLPDGQSALDYYHQIKDLFRRAGMNVQEFCSNSKQLMSSIPESDRMKNLDPKVLGVRWDSANDDTLRLARSSKFQVSEQLTKRKVLQAIAAVFDPLGLFQPATFPAKLFLQKLWFQGETWDSPLSLSLTIEWQSLRESLESVFDFRIPRYIGKLDSFSSFIVFSDASGKGYGATVYLRTKQASGGWSVNLIFAKSRLAPHHPPKSKASKNATSQRTSLVSLPRLELLGVVVAVAAASFCRDAVQLCDLPVMVFTDSECVLHWIKSENPMKLFVERRVEKIRALTNSQFRYVNTNENPADLLTRGRTGAELVQNELWWHGPPWLTKPVDEWPETRVPPVSSEACKEFKVVPASLEHTLATVEVNESVSLLGLSVDRYSELPRLLRVTWQQLKFLKLFLWSKQPATSQRRWPEVHRIFEQISTDHFRATDYQVVLKMWIRVVQNAAYSEEIAAFQQQRSKKMPLIQQLNLRMDDDGLLRACGRFQHADLPESTRNPVLLPKDHTFTKLVIQDVHAQLKHAGPTHTLSEVRRTYWVPRGRNYITSVIRSCTLCKRFKTTHEFKLPPMPPWPAERVSRSAPFQFIGLDYFGPLKVRVGEDVQKMWASIFTCLATRAIHLEPVTDCTPSEFHNCLKRFIARRGCPQQVFSDNAAYFQLVKILASKSWKEVPLDKAILTYSAQHGIEWKFITALAPWQGGHYERLVGVVKSILKTTVGRRLLSWTDLITLMAEAEAIVNSRPITYVNSEVDYSFKILRPVDFLLFRPVTSPPPASTDFSVKDLGEGGKHLASLWKSRERYLQKLWSIWYDEYLQNLRERQSIFHRGGRTRIDRIPVEGEVVILREDDLPRGSWKLARVTKLIPSSDARVRTAEIQLANGYRVNRAISFLIPLEASEQPNNQAQTQQQAENQVEDNEHNQADIQQDVTDDSQSQSFFGFSQEDVLRTVHLLQLYDEQRESQQ